MVIYKMNYLHNKYKTTSVFHLTNKNQAAASVCDEKYINPQTSTQIKFEQQQKKTTRKKMCTRIYEYECLINIQSS